MPTAPQIDVPFSLGSFFPPDSDEESQTQELDRCFEVQEVTLVGESLQVRQSAYHSHNANCVWPGTFNLAEYLLARYESTNGRFRQNWGSVLELGTATGVLAIRLARASVRYSVHDRECDGGDCVCDDIVTSDVDDDDEVEDQVTYNFNLNGFENESERPVHVPHTWGTGWKQCAARKGLESKVFDTVIASDILLYVSAYPALVQTLTELLAHPKTKFVMSWNRRMKESKDFFDRMQTAGFECKHEGKCVYTFYHTSTKNVQGFSQAGVGFQWEPQTDPS